MEYVADPSQRKMQEGDAQVESSLKTIQVFADVSFAPPHEGHKSVQGIMVEHNSNLIFWESVRQSTVALSTCESELAGYTEGYTAGEGVASLLGTLGFQVERHLRGDNKAALTVCSQQVGAWRTRHLRIKSAKLREVLKDHSSGWKAFHLRGTSLPSDGMTKGLQGQSFKRFFDTTNLKEREVAATIKKVVARTESGLSWFHKASVALAGLGAILMKSQFCLVGSLVVLCSLLCEWRGRTKDRKKNEKTAQEPVKEKGGPSIMDWSGTVTPKGGLTGMAKVEGLLGGCSPGLRALRVEDGRKQSHGSNAAARGRAAMASASGGSSLNAAGDGQSVHELAGSGNRDRQEVQVDVEIGEISEALKVKLRVSSERTKKNDEARSSADHGEPTMQPEGTKTFLEAREDFPWLLRRFRDEPSNGNDVWDEALWESYGWLVRVHKKGRVRPFHPLHRTTPGEGRELDGHRVTVFFQAKKQVGVHQDDWRDPANSSFEYPVGQWKGYTFFRKKREDQVHQEGDVAVSDGSYEKVGSDDTW